MFGAHLKGLVLPAGDMSRSEQLGCLLPPRHHVSTSFPKHINATPRRSDPIVSVVSELGRWVVDDELSLYVLHLHRLALLTCFYSRLDLVVEVQVIDSKIGER